jgi:hypothetical protein
VDDKPGLFDSSLYRDAFPDHGATPLYTLDWVPRAHRRHRRDALGGRSQFRDLERLMRTELAR